MAWSSNLDAATRKLGFTAYTLDSSAFHRGYLLVGWISASASTEYERVRLVYKVDGNRTRCYILVDALALIHPTGLCGAYVVTLSSYILKTLRTGL